MIVKLIVELDVAVVDDSGSLFPEPERGSLDWKRWRGQAQTTVARVLRHAEEVGFSRHDREVPGMVIEVDDVTLPAE